MVTRLQPDQFARLVREGLDSYLNNQGFSALSAEAHPVSYRRGHVEVRVSDFTDHPPFELIIVVGLLGPDGASVASVPLWRVADGELPCLFRDAESLRTLLGDVAARQLPRYGPSLWDSPERLRVLHREGVAEAQREEAEAIASQDLELARRALDEGRIEDALLAFAAIPEEALSARDRRRLYEARRQGRA